MDIWAQIWIVNWKSPRQIVFLLDRPFSPSICIRLNNLWLWVLIYSDNCYLITYKIKKPLSMYCLLTLISLRLPKYPCLWLYHLADPWPSSLAPCLTVSEYHKYLKESILIYLDVFCNNFNTQYRLPNNIYWNSYLPSRIVLW